MPRGIRRVAAEIIPTRKLKLDVPTLGPRCSMFGRQQAESLIAEISYMELLSRIPSRNLTKSFFSVQKNASFLSCKYSPSQRQLRCSSIESPVEPIADAEKGQRQHSFSCQIYPSPKPPLQSSQDLDIQTQISINLTERIRSFLKMSAGEFSDPQSPVPAEYTEEENGEVQGNGLQIEGPPEGLEKIWDYEAGGHHPVHLGDLLGSAGRYRVIHKLGNGGFANVWLCRDTNSEIPEYVALKILMADHSTSDCRELRVLSFKNLDLGRDQGADHICLPLDHFWFEGPNGSHLCFVYPVAGPRVTWLGYQSEDPARSLRKVAHQAVKAMTTLHKAGICHGDFTPSNILLRITGLNGLSEEEVIKVLGEPQLARILTYSEEEHSEPTAPKYVVEPVDFYHVDRKFVTDQVFLIDFGESFEISAPPEDLGTPLSYCSPELMLDSAPSIGSDLWALGCTLFEIRTGRKLLDPFDDDMDDYLYYMVLLFGVLPEPWWSTTWENRKNFYKDDPDSQGRAIKIDSIVAREPEGMREARSIQDKLEGGLSLAIPRTPKLIRREITRHEIDIFGALLGRIFQYQPSDRLTAAEVENHEWFQL